MVVAFLSSDPQKPPGHGLGQPAAADPALSRRLDGMIPRGAHQPQFSVRPWAEVAALLAVPHCSQFLLGVDSGVGSSALQEPPSAAHTGWTDCSQA